MISREKSLALEARCSPRANRALTYDTITPEDWDMVATTAAGGQVMVVTGWNGPTGPGPVYEWMRSNEAERLARIAQVCRDEIQRLRHV